MTFKGSRIASFTFLGENRPVSEWKDLLVGLCEMMYEKHPAMIKKRVFEIHGTMLIYFSEDPRRANMREPKPIGNSGIWVETKWDADVMYNKCLLVLKKFGYTARDLKIENF